MKCFNHPEIDANGSCNNCRKGLCGECVSRFDFPLCEQCLLEHNSNASKDLYFGLAITAVIFVAVTYFIYTNIGHQGQLGVAMFMGGLMAGTYWGWRFLTDHLPSLTMGSIVVWYFYFILKFVGAYFIGLFVGPYQIFRMFRELGRIQEVKGQIERGEI